MKWQKFGCAALVWGAFQGQGFSFPEEPKKVSQDPPKVEVQPQKRILLFRRGNDEVITEVKPQEGKKDEKKVEIRVIKEPTKQEGKVPGKTETKVQCHVIIIGPDGKKTEYSLGDGKELPPEIKKLIEEALAKAGVKGGKGNVEVQKKVIVIGKDGKPVEQKPDPKKGVQFQFVVNGVDGKVSEELKKKIAAAMAGQKGAVTVLGAPGIATENSKKLDLILQRLEKIEKEIEGLKKK
ncbi:MAG: hypothetical protein EXR99_07780 [Gemmataceae bacterium]|nr:hypothetical protein [Gemmataceae bacterium]